VTIMIVSQDIFFLFLPKPASNLVSLAASAQVKAAVAYVQRLKQNQQKKKSSMTIVVGSRFIQISI
jgi:hypothetical protein